MASTMEWIRRNYGVPARHGMRITYRGKPATIIGAGGGGYLRIRIDGEKRATWDHPTYAVIYPEVPRPARPRGWCSWCSQDRAMTQAGVMGKHRPHFPTNEDCPGAGKPPMWPVEYRTNAETAAES
ncbi:hypothetical protein ACLF6K_37280 [Streptomyces xanthophaeus]|uniref:hypothetical protein n=1 Tax=Streptomyces xanthophaeus TaxID=67385 RepID=UPI003990399D